jgi:HAD superfamily hydrolase (TIGR01509 family)
MRRPAIFLDDGGVMNDNLTRGAQWQRLVGEFFPPLLGGAPAAWAEANRVVATALFEDYQRTMGGQAEADFNAWLRGYRIAWVRDMCAYVGLPPPSEEDCLDLNARASAYVTTRVRAAFPGVVEALRAVHGLGHTLHTASGEESDDLHGYLTGMGVRDCFTGLYGPDLINTPKEGPLYYERVFADAGIDPRDATVVDDFPGALAWAAAAGARTVLVRSDRGESDNVDLVLDALSDLPAALDRL